MKSGQRIKDIEHGANVSDGEAKPRKISLTPGAGKEATQAQNKV